MIIRSLPALIEAICRAQAGFHIPPERQKRRRDRSNRVGRELARARYALDVASRRLSSLRPGQKWCDRLIRPETQQADSIAIVAEVLRTKNDTNKANIILMAAHLTRAFGADRSAA